MIDKKTVYIAALDGSVLKGNLDEFELLTRVKSHVYGLGYFQNRLLLAGGGTRVWELKDKEAHAIKDNVKVIGMVESRNVL